MSTRKTLSMPNELISAIEAEAARECRSFSNVVVRRLRDVFLCPEGVRRLPFNGLGLSASKAPPTSRKARRDAKRQGK